MLFIQVRWLARAPTEPVVWYGELDVKRNETDTHASLPRWEDWQTLVFARLESAPDLDGPARGYEARPINPVSLREGLSFTGCYSEVPVGELQTRADVASRIVEPAFGRDLLESSPDGSEVE